MQKSVTNKYVPDEKSFRVQELAKTLGCSDQIIRSWIREGCGPNGTKLNAINSGTGSKNKSYLIFGFNVNKFLELRSLLEDPNNDDYYIN